MSELLPYQRQFIDAILSGAKPTPLWSHGRRTGKSFRDKMIREYCEANGIPVVELGDAPRKPVEVWHDEAPNSWVKKQFVTTGVVWVGFDPVAPR